MTQSPTPQELFETGRKLLPSWNDNGPDTDARHAQAVALVTRAAEAGYLPAIEELAEGLGGPAAFDWAVALAKRGDSGSLVSVLTSYDWPFERCTAVLDAARAGEPWAMVAIGRVYGLGMQDTATGEYVATKDGAFGFLPGVRDPKAEARRWLEQAADAGSAAAALKLAQDDRDTDPGRALIRLGEALREPDRLLPEQRRRAQKLVPALLDATGAPEAARVEAWTRLAEAGDEDAWVWLGDRAREGDGEPKDAVRARACYERAAATGSVSGSRELAKLLESGAGGPPDEARARALYEQAAELGNDSYARDRLAERWGLTWYARQGKTLERAAAKRTGREKEPRATKKPAPVKKAAPAKKPALVKKPASAKKPAKKPKR